MVNSFIISAIVQTWFVIIIHSYCVFRKLRDDGTKTSLGTDVRITRESRGNAQDSYLSLYTLVYNKLLNSNILKFYDIVFISKTKRYKFE